MGSAPLDVDGVWKGYSRGTQWIEVLGNVSLSVEWGEVGAVTGSRLDGKTTLLRVAAGLERPDSGIVSVGRHTKTDRREDERSRLLGHQIVWLDRAGPGLNVEVSRFVGWPLALHGRGRRRAEREATQMLERVGARMCLDRRWGELSSREQVLVGLARAFAGSPIIVVIDDLLDGLGGPATEETSDLLRSLIEESKPGCGVLMSASDIESAMFADRIWSITGKRSLKLMGGRHAEGKVIPLPERDSARVGRQLGI